MRETGPPAEEPLRYVVRLREYASRDLNAAVLHFAQTASGAIAMEWLEGFRTEIATLATMPRRCPRVPERFHIEARQLLYRRGKSSVAYRILFTITGEEPDSLDPPTVAILHIRHGATKPLTRAQIREIEAAE